ncbi:YihY/virulence factor BrkB family protein [Lacticaseibacillus thailandensis]|uniref:YihY/virulence factor BrkB family protein n=1 Tax=Lacticaseibacillus thailandensis TaxID=381741 RepID=UPI0006D29951|nr:YhjD/YihY/BrkB family envelope integrity protein [Lacticaseibacillus thailandensis]
MPKRTVFGHRVSAASWQELHDRNEQRHQPIHRQHLTPKQRWAAILDLLGRRVNAAQIDQTAAAMAYYAILSAFPAALIVFNLVSRIGVSSFGLRTTVTQVVPANVMATIRPVLASLAAKPNTTWVGIGTIFTLWAASLCIASMRSGFNRAYGIRATVQNFFSFRVWYQWCSR